MPSADAHKEQLRRALVHLLRHNLPQYIRQAVASQNHPTISYTPSSGDVVQRQHGSRCNFAAIRLMILRCSRKSAAHVGHGYRCLKAFLGPVLKVGCAAL